MRRILEAHMIAVQPADHTTIHREKVETMTQAPEWETTDAEQVEDKYGWLTPRPPADGFVFRPS